MNQNGILYKCSSNSKNYFDKENRKTRENKQKTTNETIELRLSISIITLNANVLITPDRDRQHR